MSAENDTTAFETARRRMVDGQVRPSDVTRPDLIDAMLWAPRERFLPKSKRALAYMGEMIETAPGRMELDPRITAKMIQALDPDADDLALVVGSAGGYVAALLSKLCAAVVALETDEALSEAAREALADCGVDTVISELGPLPEGRPQHAPYNLIFVAGAAPAPSAQGEDPLAPLLRDQLADGGRLVTLRADGAAGRCEIIVKSGEIWSARRVFDASAPVLPGFEREANFEF